MRNADREITDHRVRHRCANTQFNQLSIGSVGTGAGERAIRYHLDAAHRIAPRNQQLNRQIWVRRALDGKGRRGLVSIGRTTHGDLRVRAGQPPLINDRCVRRPDSGMQIGVQAVNDVFRRERSCIAQARGHAMRIKVYQRPQAIIKIDRVMEGLDSLDPRWMPRFQ